MDTTQVLGIDTTPKMNPDVVDTFFILFKQCAGQLAAIRELLEAEQARTAAQRIHQRELAKKGATPWPAAAADPPSHTG